MAREGGKANIPGMHMEVRGQPARMVTSLSTTWGPEVKFRSLLGLETSALMCCHLSGPQQKLLFSIKSLNRDCLASGQKPP